MPWTDYIDDALAAYGGYQSARQANRPTSQRTDQTTTQNPFGLPLIAPDIEAALDYQRQLMSGGPRYVGGGAPARGGGAGGGARGGTAPAGGGARAGRPTTWTNARGETMTMGAGGRAVRATNQGGTTPGGTPSPAGPAAPQGIEGISNEVARRAFDAGNDSTTMAARQGVENILAGQGQGSGFGTYNPINDYLAGELHGDVEGRDAANLIRNFLGVGADGTYRGDGGGFSGSSGRGARYGPPAYVQQMTGGSSTTPGGGGVPDTVGNSNAYFATQLRELMDSEANDADLQAMIDAQNADVTRSMRDDLWALDAQAQGTGRYGGDMWAGLSNQARTGAAQQAGINASRTRLGELENRRALYANLLGQVNTRDLGAMQDRTQRYGIDASARAAGAGASEAAALQRRGQDLQALMGLLGHDEFNVGALGGLGEQLSGDQFNAIGMAPGLAGVGLSGLGLANDAAGNLVANRGNDVSLRNAQMAAGTARAGMNLERDMFNSQAPQNLVNNYMSMIRGIGGMGGTSHTAGTNVVPGAGINPWAAAALAGGSNYYGGR